MSQAISAAGYRFPASTPIGDAPDFLFVLRHYRWLLVIGTLVGTLITLSSFWLARKYIPNYTAWVQYQVLPPVGETSAFNTGQEAQAVLSEDVLRFIARQSVLVTDDQVLNDALKTDAFQFNYLDKDMDPSKRRPSAFMLNNAANPKLALKTRLEVKGLPNTDLYRVQISGSDPQEITEEVRAFALVYEGNLRTAISRTSKIKLGELQDTRKELQQRVDVAASDVENYREAHDIPGLIQSNNRMSQSLATMDTAVVGAETETNQARANFESIKKQIDSGTFKLPPDAQYQVDNDPQVVELGGEKRALQREREVMLNDHGPAYPAIKALDIRISACEKQADELRDDAAARARLMVVENAQRGFSSAEAREQDLRTRRNELLLQVKDLDSSLNGFNTRQDRLKEAQALLSELDQKILQMEVERNSDASRLRQNGESGVPDKDEPTFPLLKWFLPIGLLGGLALALGLAYLLELTNTRVRTPRDITRTMQMPLLGFVPDQEDDAIVNGDLVTSIRTSPSSMIAESFRQIRGRLAAVSDGRPLSTMLVASMAPGGGATTVASNLANGIALNGVRVLLVDANFYRPGLAAIYRKIPAVGLSDVIAGKVKAEDAIVESAELPGLHLMGTGTKPNTTPSELLETKAFREILTELKSKYDLVIFDGAPLSLVSDSLSLAAKLDGVVAVVRAGTITRGTVGRIREQLRQVRANLLGIVLNAAQTHGSGYFKENYRSFYQYAASTNAPRKSVPTLGN